MLRIENKLGIAAFVLQKLQDIFRAVKL